MKKSDNRQRLLALGVVLVMLLLPACGAVQQPTASEQAPMVDSSTPTASIPAPVTEINCIKPTSMPTILPAGKGRVVACWSDYDASTTHLRIVDLQEDAIVNGVDMTGCLDLFPECFEDCSYVLRDSEAGEWVFLNGALSEQSCIKAEVLDGFFTHDRSHYYFLQDRRLFCTNLVTGQTLPVDTTSDLRFSSMAAFDPQENIIALNPYLSPLSTNCGTAILELDSDSLTMLSCDLFQVSFGDCFTKLLRFDNDILQYELLYGTVEEAMSIPATRFDNREELYPVSGTDFLVGVSDNTVLYRLNRQGMDICSLSDYGIYGALRDVCWSREDDMLIGSVWDNGLAKVYCIIPDSLSYSGDMTAVPVLSPITVDSSFASCYWGILSGNALPESLQELRSIADTLEQTYGVEILLSGQCAELARYSSFTLELTEQWSQDTEAEAIRVFLVALDYALSLFPEDYFLQFRSSAGDGGICFLPVAGILSDSQLVGLCYETNGWNVIALDCNTERKVSCLCHELWHATENMLSNKDYSVFRDECWQRFNPVGFEYSQGREEAEPYHWTLFDGSEEVYFIDTYARTNDREDRARLFEYVMAEPNYWSQMKDCPHLLEKLNYMSGAVVEGFDTTAWETMPWDAFWVS